MSQIYSPKEESAIRTATTDDVMNDTLLALESLGTGTWVPFSHKKLPELLYYEQRQGDSLWDPNQGLQTFGKVVGFTWNKNFFANVLDKHLSYPVHSPWVFSPFISANRNPDAFSGRRISDPRSVLLISVGKSIFHNEKLCIYSLRRLVEDFKIPSSKLQYRPYWEDEYLILDHVPIEAIGTIDCAGVKSRGQVLGNFPKLLHQDFPLKVPEVQVPAFNDSIRGYERRYLDPPGFYRER